MGEVAFYVEHQITYSNRDPLPVQDVIDSLAAMKQLTQRVLPSVLSSLTKCKIVEITLLVDGFEDGSFKENTWLGFVFANERNYKRFQKAVRNLDWAAMYKELPPHGKPVIKTVAVTSVVAALIMYAVVKYNAESSNEPQRALIEANNNVIVAIGAEAYDMDPQAFANALSAAVARKDKDITQSAAGILAPARREAGSTVTIGETATISNPVVLAMPTNVDSTPYQSEQQFTNIVIDIRATNRDSTTTGWRGRIAGEFDAKVRLKLGEGVEIKDLAGKLEVRADVTVTYQMNTMRGSMEPHEILITALRDDAGELTTK